MAYDDRKVVYVYAGSPGLLAGIFGCVLALLGLFTIGLIFVPLAAICSALGMLRGAVYWNLAGFGSSLLGMVLTFIGLASSPALLAILAAMMGQK